MNALLLKLGIVDKSSFWVFVIQFLKFGIVGISNTLIGLGGYYLLIYLGVNYILANIIAFVAGTCNAYFWNSRYVFKKTDNGTVKPLVKTFITYGSTLLLGTGLLFIMVEILKISQWIAPLINLCVTIPCNFLLTKFWVFRKKALAKGELK